MKLTFVTLKVLQQPLSATLRCFTDCSLYFTHISHNLAGQRLDRRALSKAFFWHEIEEEMRERSLDWAFVGKVDEAKDDFLVYVEKCRRKELYTHNEEDCSPLCKKRGR